MERKKRVVPREVSSADGNRVWNPSVTTNGEKSAEAIVNQRLQTVDPRTLQDIMGHASMKMTMELYNHVTDERLTNEIQKLNNRRIS